MSVEISTDVSLRTVVDGNSHRNFVRDCKISLEISTDIFSKSQNDGGYFHGQFVAGWKMMSTNSTEISLMAKMSLEISTDIFLSQLKCPGTFSFYK